MFVFRAIANVSLFTFSVSISPLLIIFYLLCWTWAKFISVVYGFKKCILLTGMDTAFSRGKNHLINCIINSLLLTQETLSVGDIKESFAEKIINATDGRNRKLFPKFTSCVTHCAGHLMWSKASNFNIDEHFRSYNGQPPTNEAELKTLIHDLCNRRLPPSKPRWQFTVIPLEYSQTSANASLPKTCVLFRIDHSFCDGVSFSQILFEILGGQVGAMKQVLSNRFKTKLRNRLLKKLEIFVQTARALFYAPNVMWKLQFNNDPCLLHKPKLSGIKIYDWSSPIKLSIIKDIRNSTATTVNDVITSCLAAALRKVFLKQGVCPHQLHTVFMMSLHSPGDPIEAKNNSIFIHSPLPTGEMGCRQRLKATKAIMDIKKRSPDIMVIRWFLRYVCGIVPYRIIQWFIEKTHQSVLLSNVPGPSNKLHFVGQIDSIIILPQIRVTNGFGVLVHTYRDEVTVSVTADAAIFNHKDTVRLLLKEFVEEIQQLHSSINV